jgi:hypothetical protein
MSLCTIKAPRPGAPAWRSSFSTSSFAVISHAPGIAENRGFYSDSGGSSKSHPEGVVVALDKPLWTNTKRPLR